MEKKRSGIDRSRYSSRPFKLKFNQKRAQITIFIILGILIMLVAVLVILMQKEIVSFKPGEIIPTKKGTIENYITNCISQEGEQALFLIGLHGGYINVSKDVSTDATQYLRLSPFTVIPYWAKGTSTRIPPLSDIKKRIDQYIQDGLKTCLLNQKRFNTTYNIIEKSKVKADTQIVDQKVIFKVKWDLEIRDKSGEVITNVVNHLAESKVKLKRIHETAKSIIETELKDLKFEDLTIDLLSLDHPQVPITGVALSCSPKTWEVDKAKKKMQDLLRVNLPQLKVQDTNFVKFPSNRPYYQNHYMWDAQAKYSDIDVTFSYHNNFPFSFEVTPRDGNLMKSGMTSGSDMISYVCLQLWKFTYDISYPVLVQVKDDQSKYVFNLAFTVHVKRNRGDRTSQGILTPSGVTISYPTSQDYCSKRTIPITVNTYELIENNDSGVYWKEPLEGVNLTYTCLKYKCEIGQTEYGFGGGGHIAAFKTNFPYCTGGILRGTKESYKEVWKRVVSNKEKVVNLDLIQLHKFPAKNIKVVKNEFKTLADLKAKKLDSGKSLGSKETVSIKITRSKEDWGPHKETLVLSSQMSKKMLEKNYLKFLAGTDYDYQLEIYLMDEKNIKGGYFGNWTVNWEKLKAGQELIFHVLTKDSFVDVSERYDLLGNLEEYSQLNSAVLAPQIK